MSLIGDKIANATFTEIKDLDFAAYLLMNNVALAESYRDGREFAFKFYDLENRIAQLAISFANSESAKYADCVRRLKKVTLSKPAFTK